MAGGMLDQAQAATRGGATPVAPTAPELAQAAAAAGAPGPQPAEAAGVPQPAGGPAPAPGGMPPNAMPTGGPAPAQGVDTSTGGRATGEMDIGEESASPEEQKEYERAMQALAQVLYGNAKTSNAIVDQIDPNDKVGSTSKVSMLFIQQLDEKVDLDESVIAQMVEESVMRIMELAEARHNITYDEREAQMIIGSTWEGIQMMFGMDEQNHTQLVGSFGSDKLSQLKEQYEAALNG